MRRNCSNQQFEFCTLSTYECFPIKFGPKLGISVVHQSPANQSQSRLLNDDFIDSFLHEGNATHFAPGNELPWCRRGANAHTRTGTPIFQQA